MQFVESRGIDVGHKVVQVITVPFKPMRTERTERVGGGGCRLLPSQGEIEGIGIQVQVHRGGSMWRGR
jgi:hypothetical protein